MLGLIVLGLLLGRMQSGYRNSGRTDPMSQGVRSLVSPAAGVMDSVATRTSDFAVAIFRGRGLEEENQRLRAIASSAQTYGPDVERLQAEIDELRKLGGWETSPGRQKVPADVIGYFPNESRITISVGADRGVKRGMPVATYEGLVGRVETVDRTSSQVLLITSTSGQSRISALIRRPLPNPPASGLIRGDGPNSLVMELADPTASVDSGDVVTTSGFSDQIPRGIVIGKVVSVQDDPAFGKRTVVVFPRVALGQVREVLVIK
ncbi:MAG: rod shape-determining protein MreC [Fimbriimonadales bacterium]